MGGETIGSRIQSGYSRSGRCRDWKRTPSRRSRKTRSPSFAADVEDFSRLMGRDEVGTSVRLPGHYQLPDGLSQKTRALGAHMVATGAENRPSPITAVAATDGRKRSVRPGPLGISGGATAGSLSATAAIPLVSHPSRCALISSPVCAGARPRSPQPIERSTLAHGRHERS